MTDSATSRTLHRFAIAAAVASLSFATLASGQVDEQQTAAPEAGASEQATDAAKPDDAESTKLDDVVVTGTKREERLQDVPQAIDYISSEQLKRQNIQTVDQLSRASTSFSSAVSGLRVRGVGGNPLTSTAESAVGVVLDGVSLGTFAGGSTVSLYDVLRVEMLLGPQGTLFGRNSSAGIVNIVTKAPDPGALDSALHYEVGDRDNLRTEGMVNVPLADNAALRVTGHSTKDPQLTYDTRFQQWDQSGNTGGRARILYELDENVELNLIGDMDTREVTNAGVFPFVEVTPGSRTETGFRNCGVTPGPENQETCRNKPGAEATTLSGVTFQADVRLGGHTLTSIVSDRRRRFMRDGDVDQSPVDQAYERVESTASSFSEEVRLASPSGKWVDYVAGLYYSDGEQDSLSTSTIGTELTGTPLDPLFAGGGNRGASRGSATSTAAFGQATVKATDALNVILGARFERAEVASAVSNTPHGPNPFGTQPSSFADSHEDKDFSWRAGLQYKWTPDLSTYLSYVRGYKGAAINDLAITPGVDPVVDPEIPKVWEAGVKSTWLDGRLATNFDLFHIDLTNFQASFLIPNGNTISAVNGNVPQATSQGVEVSVLGTVTDSLSLKAGVTYLDTEYGAGYAVGGCAAGSDPRCMSTAGGTFYDAEGLPFSYVSDWKGLFSGEYTTSLNDSLDGFAQADVVYSSDYRQTVFDGKSGREAQTLLGARVGVRTPNDRFGISVFGRNLLDEFRPSAVVRINDTTYINALNVDTRRTLGIAMDVRFY